jgi:tight adherence protein B
MIGPLLFGTLVGLGVLVLFMASLRTLAVRDPIGVRLKEYGVTGELDGPTAGANLDRRRSFPATTRLLYGFGLGPALARDLVRADVPLTIAEYALVAVACGLAGGLVGLWRAGPLLGLLLAGVGAFIPVIYVRNRGGRRVRQLTEQLPDVLTLLVGALRAGYGLPQAINMLVEQLPPPASVEFGRVMRAIGLGAPVQRALSQMADRVSSDDLDLVVTAVGVQYELGGNLVQTLDTISETVRERIRIKREIRVLTAQQRLTGYILAFLPAVLALALSIMNPGYLQPLFEPGLIRLLPVAAVVMQVVGFLAIRKIVDIEV